MPAPSYVFMLLVVICSMSVSAEDAQTVRRSLKGPFLVTDGFATAPFGSAVSAAITNYTRGAPYIGTAGRLTGGGVAEAKRLGFKLIIDLRQSDEDGVAEEQAAVKALNIAYRNIPLASDASVWEQLAEIEAILDDTSNYPILLHCGSANRAGAAWALYRHLQGVDAVTALEEGLAAGLTSRETFVRTLLELPVE